MKKRHFCKTSVGFVKSIAVLSAFLALEAFAVKHNGQHLMNLPIQSAAKELSTRSSPLTYSFPVKEQHVIEVSGRIHVRGVTNYLRSAIFAINIYDEEGKDLAVKELSYSPSLKGYFRSLQGGPEPLSFNLELRVPQGAAYAKIRLLKHDKNHRVALSSFSCALTKPRNLMRILLLVCLLWGVAGIGLAVLRRRKATNDIMDVGISGPVNCGRVFSVWRVSAIVLASVLAIVFLFAINIAVSMKQHGEMIESATVLGYVLFLVLATALLCSVFRRGRRMQCMAVPAIMLVCFLLHVVAISITHALYVQSMVSDFAQVEKCILSPTVIISHGAEYFYWCNFELLCSALGKVFCRDIRVVQYLNAICCVLAVFPVFKLSERAAGFSMAVFTSLLVGISPIMLIYSMIPTSEFIAAFMNIYALYFIIRMLESITWAEKCRYALWCGLFLGIGQLMKPFASIFIVATAIMVTWDLCRFGWRRTWRWAVVFAFLLGTYLLVSESCQSAIIQIAKPQRIEKTGKNIVRTLLLGLNAETNGGFNKERSSWIRGMSEEERSAALRKLIKNDYAKLPTLFATKFRRIYSIPAFGWSWYENSILPQRVPMWLKSSMCVWNFVALFLVCLGVAGLAASRGIAEEKGRVGVVAALVTAAFTSMLVLVEVQERYKMAIYPVFFLLVPYVRTWFSVKDNLVYEGAMKLFAVVKERIKRGRRK